MQKSQDFGLGYSTPGRRMWYRVTQHSKRIIATICLITVGFVIVSQLHSSDALMSRSGNQHVPTSHSTDVALDMYKDQKLHIMLPTSRGDVNLCKTIISARALGYSTPVLVGWNVSHNTNYLLGGGSHVAKISKVLEWLNDRKPEEEQDLVLMMDAFDIWFQLRPETLIQRYHSINNAANERIAETMGKAAEIEGIKQTIIFGAGKRCAPNQPQSVACYTLPQSPIADDVYGGNTDTIIGRNQWTSARQRYLNSGYIIGPVGDMRVLFERAWKKAQDWPDHDPEDNGSRSSDFMYHGSDQAAFAVIFGEQEYQREVMRRRHSSWNDKAKIWKSEITKGESENKMQGTSIGDDILNPPFTHQTMEELPGRTCEFGIGLDYFSELGHQTANAEYDGTWLRYNQTLDEIRNVTQHGRNKLDCEYSGKGMLPKDVSQSRAPVPAGEWDQIELYTNICLDTIPVMVHHNGDKSARERMWPRLWSQPFVKEMVEADKADTTSLGALAYNHGFIDWDELCPARYTEELFRVKTNAGQS